MTMADGLGVVSQRAEEPRAPHPTVHPLRRPGSAGAQTSPTSILRPHPPHAGSLPACGVNGRPVVPVPRVSGLMGTISFPPRFIAGCGRCGRGRGKAQRGHRGTSGAVAQPRPPTSMIGRSTAGADVRDSCRG